MTGLEFEQKVCQMFKDGGYWALNIPRSRTGQQPFDVIAIKGNCLVAVDCKVMSGNSHRFPLDRVEVNQWMAFKALEERSLNTVIGLVIWHEFTGQMFFISYKSLKFAKSQNKASIELENHRLEQIDLLRRIRE